MRWTPGVSLFLLGLLAAAPAAAAELLTPTGESVPSLVRSESAGGNYHNLPPGQRLEFQVQGPRTLEVSLRQRLPSPGSPVSAARATVLLDGQVQVATRVEGNVEPNATVTDIPVGAVTRVSQAPVAVPEGKHVLTIVSEANNPPLLVQVSVSEAWGAGAPDVASDDIDLTALLADDEEEAWTTPSAPPASPAPATPAPASATPSSPTPVASTPPPAEPAEIEPGTARGLGELEAGVRLGLGTASAGTSPSLYLGLEARLPVGEHLRLTGAVGRYGIHLEQDLAIQPALGGLDAQTTQTVDWRTRVRPLELGAQLHTGLGGSDTELYLGAALATYLSTRIQDEEVQRGLSVGRAWSTGLNIPVKDFVLSPSLSVNAGKRRFDNPTVDGDIAREQLRTTRVNLALFYSF